MIAIYPGSFDPLTDGHFSIIQRAARLFDEIVVAVGYNPAKQTMYSASERVQIIKAATKHIANVRVDSFTQTLLVNYVRTIGGEIIIKGLRNVADFQNEFQQFNMNAEIAPELETVFLLADSAELFVSSTLVREMIQQNSADYRLFVPTDIVHALEDMNE